MVDKTPNHGLNKYEQGDTNWTHSADMQTIEERLVIRDEEGNLGNYSPHSGATFVATDTGAVYDGDGTEWQLASRKVSSLTVTDSLSVPSDSSGIKARGSYRNVPSGIVYVDSNNDYVAESFITDETWSDSNDTGIVLQSLLDNIRDAKGEPIGEIQFGVGSFNFDSPVSFSEHGGTTLTGQSFRQSNNQSGTLFRAGSLPSGRGILEFGNIGDGNNPGGGAGSHIRNIYMNLGRKNVVGIYNWAQDRVRTTDVKVENVGPAGNGVAFLGSYNTAITDSYFVQAAFLYNHPRTKSMNSLRFHNVTFNTNNSTHPPLIISSQGTRITNGIFNGVDGPNMEDGLAVVSGDASKTGLLDSDDRVSASEVSGQVSRLQISSSAFVTGGNDVRVFNDIEKSEITSSRFSSSGVAIHGFSRLAVSACRFTATGRESLYRPGDGSGGVSTIVGCEFKNFGQDSGEPAIRFGSSQAHRCVVSNNAFRSTNGASNDIVLENNADSIIVTGNWVDSGISGSISGTKSSRKLASKVVANSSNPIGFSRTSPNLPSGTGAGDFVSNLHLQGAWIYHDGSGVNIQSFGESTKLATDQSPIFVPRGGKVWFDNSTPSAWDWWWV